MWANTATDRVSVSPWAVSMPDVCVEAVPRICNFAFARNGA
jgi:hypothetical protein